MRPLWQRSRPSLVMLPLVALLLVAMNLRGAITAVGPVLPEITGELGLSGTAAGLLTALPVLCFAALAPAASWFGRWVGLDRAILLTCLVIALGTAVRVFGGTPLLFTGTFVVGAAMTVGNVLVPVIVKRDFPDRVGSVTGLYTAALIVGASMAAGFTAPISAVTDWRFGLAVWSMLALAAAIVWHGATRHRGTSRVPAAQTEQPDQPEELAGAEQRAEPAPPAGGDARAIKRAVWTSPVAWAVALMLGAQAAAYYAMTAWLPTLLVDEIGASLQTAGLSMSLFQFLGLAGTLAVATLVAVRPQQVWLIAAAAALWLVMLVGLMVAPGWWAVWSVAGGLGQGMGITLAMSLIALRSHDAAVASELSGMVQFVGYLAAAAAPLVVGALNDATGAWTLPLIVMIVIVCGKAVVGLVAGRDVTIGVREPDVAGAGSGHGEPGRS